MKNLESEPLWQKIVEEARMQSIKEPVLASYFHAAIIKHKSLSSSLSYILANRLMTVSMPAMAIRDVIDTVLADHPSIIEQVACDINAIITRDPAVSLYMVPLLYLKGFHALQGYRIAHKLWAQEQYLLATFLQNQISITCQVDIHPAAQIGQGIMLDHATGVVIGETAVVEDNVSILQDVTLGGTGKNSGDRHPKIRQGVMIGAGAKILGSIEVGEGAKVASCSVVLHKVPPHTTVAGIPAKIVGKPRTQTPSIDMDQKFNSPANYFSDGGGI